MSHFESFYTVPKFGVCFKVSIGLCLLTYFSTDLRGSILIDHSENRIGGWMKKLVSGLLTAVIYYELSEVVLGDWIAPSILLFFTCSE